MDLFATLSLIAFISALIFSLIYIAVQTENKCIRTQNKLDEITKEMLYWKRLFEEMKSENKALKQTKKNNE